MKLFFYWIYLYEIPDSKNVSFFLMQVKSGTIFDNFLITNDPNLAEEVGNDTWGKTKVSPKLLYLNMYPAHTFENFVLCIHCIP